MLLCLRLTVFEHSFLSLCSSLCHKHEDEVLDRKPFWNVSLLNESMIPH